MTAREPAPITDDTEESGDPLATASARPRGGWTGFWTLLWAALVGVPAAVAGASLLLVAPTAELARLRIEEIALQEQLPPDVVVEPAQSLSDAVLWITGLQQPWLLAITALCIALVVAGLGLLAGSETARRCTRVLLGLLVLTAGGAAAQLGTDVVARFAADAEILRGALVRLANAVGEPLDRGLLDALFDPTWVVAVAWAPVALVGLPTIALWLVVGRRSLRDWCAGR